MPLLTSQQIRNIQSENEQNPLSENDTKIKADLLYWKSGKTLETAFDENQNIVINIIKNNRTIETVPLNMGDDFFPYIGESPLYSDANLLVYENSDCYHNDNITFAFKDERGKWHNGHFGQGLVQHNGSDYSNSSPYNTEKEIHQYISKLKTNGHLIDNEGNIYFRNEKGHISDTGFKRDEVYSHLAAAEIYSDSFTIQETKENYLDGDFYSGQNITKNTLYQRQKDGSYKPVIETAGQAIRKAEFANNVYFTGGSLRHPKKEKFIILGEASPEVIQKCKQEVANNPQTTSRIIKQERQKD